MSDCNCFDTEEDEKEEGKIEEDEEGEGKIEEDEDEEEGEAALWGIEELLSHLERRWGEDSIDDSKGVGTFLAG